jgi:hypothetical protein
MSGGVMNPLTPELSAGLEAGAFCRLNWGYEMGENGPFVSVDGDAGP